jgi:drug/metabolite transporter (DMT)-like permease
LKARVPAESAPSLVSGVQVVTNRSKGVCCIVASAFGFALMALCVRLCDDFGDEISCFQKSFFRNLIAFVLAAAVFVRGRADRRRAAAPALTVSDVRLLAARSVFGFVGILANFYALSKIPLGEAMTLNKTAPFFTVLFSWLLLGERASRRQLLPLVSAFAGVLLVMRPGFRAAETFSVLCALAGGLGAGLAYVCVHQLGRRRVDSACVVLFFSAFSSLASIPFFLPVWRPMTPAQLLILLGAGAAAAIGQFGVTAAYRFAQPRQIAVYDYTNVLFTALFGFLFFGQTPDVLSVAGFVVILCSAVAMRRTSGA